MMGQAIDKSWSPIHELLISAVKQARLPSHGGNQKQREIDDARKNGITHGICEGVAAIINEKRVEMFPRAKMVPACSEHDVYKLVRTSTENRGAIAAAFDEYDAATHLARKASNADDKERLNAEALENLTKALDLQIYILVSISDEMVAAYEQERRALIVAGELAPEPGDTEWLEMEWTRMMDQADKLKKLAEAKK